MALAAHSRELSLFDVIQVKGASRATCRVAVRVRGTLGVLFLNQGAVVYASFGPRQGEDAAIEILQEPHCEYHVTSDVIVPPPNMSVGHEALVLEAMRRHAEAADRPGPSGRARAPSPADPPVDPVCLDTPTEERVPLPPALARPHRRSLVVMTAALLVVLVGPAALALGLRRTRMAPGSRSARSSRPVASISRSAVASSEADASALRGQGDRAPIALTALRVPSPEPTMPLRPTIVCRLLIDASGAVAEARIYQHREGLEAFEEAALAAVKSARFEPALRDGRPVDAWLNWPVEFRELAPEP